MMNNRNEDCLLKYISKVSPNNELFEVISKYGIKLKFKDYNAVYQTIDELNYSNLTDKETA